MFRGFSHVNLDAKGRFAMPARYRASLVDLCDNHLVVTIDPQTQASLLIYPLPEWERIEVELSRLPSGIPKARSMVRVLMSFASDIDIDGAGRILMPQELRKRAGLEKEMVLIGQGRRFELWNASRWDEQCEKDLAELSDPAEMPEEIVSLVL